MTPHAEAQSTQALNIVATSGKQRMLSQRVFKAYAQWSLGVLPDKANSILAASLAELKKGNATLREVGNNNVLAGAQAQAVLIDKLVAATSAPPSPASLQQTALISEELLVNAEALTQLLVHLRQWSTWRHANACCRSVPRANFWAIKRRPRHLRCAAGR
jgi:hypothetical protein